MKVTRRDLVRVLAWLGLFVGFGTVADRSGVHGARGAQAGTEASTLRAFLQTLIPDDEMVPGALELGIHTHIRARASASPSDASLLDDGCRWLDEQAKRLGADNFAGLDEHSQQLVVARAADAEISTLPGYFFVWTRNEAFTQYYADPRVWTAIQYDGPPQPEGFLDYTGPPQAKE